MARGGQPKCPTAMPSQVLATRRRQSTAGRTPRVAKRDAAAAHSRAGAAARCGAGAAAHSGGALAGSAGSVTTQRAATQRSSVAGGKATRAGKKTPRAPGGSSNLLDAGAGIVFVFIRRGNTATRLVGFLV